MYPAIFLDRDGVIIENRLNYVLRWEDVDIFPQALQALARIRFCSYKIIIVTNQSAIGRGLITLEAAWEINNRLLCEVQKAGGRIDRIFMCPHTPDDHCSCRKPQPGLILKAARDLHLDLNHSIIIGDTLNDLAAGEAAGLQSTILVQTGLGATQLALPEAKTLRPFKVYATLAEALAAFVGNIG
ncbi:MAG: HAD family hydrolase [Chloroflexi bacterium]|nr:HAD family hydrolase [Chloroflexota bacterium]